MPEQASLPSSSSSSKVSLKKARHTKYWLRCLKTHLPTAYIGNDSQRMTLAFFILSALDLLDELDAHITASDRQAYIDWVYRCQHPEGGFKGFTGADGGEEMRDRPGRCWDPANLAATFFALAILMLLGDSMEMVERKKCLLWVRSLQRPDGSFGEAIGRNGRIEGIDDTRHCYLAACVRWILRRGERMDGVEDVDVNGLARFVEQCTTYDGGIAQAPFHEAHAGLTYCGIGVFKLLGKLPSRRNDSPGAANHSDGDDFVRNMIRWLVSRQTLFVSDDQEHAAAEEDTDPIPDAPMPSFQVQGAFPVSAQELSQSVHDSVEFSPEGLQWAGFNGRCNKEADTCYAFWVGASLGMLQKVHLQNFNAVHHYLLDKTQHIIGGFGKMPGDPPDIMHSYLGLAALSTMHEPELKSIDPSLCISVSARELFESRPVDDLQKDDKVA